MSEKTCCPTENNNNHNASPSGFKLDWVLHGSLLVIISSVFLHVMGVGGAPMIAFAHAQLELLTDMSWGIILGLLSVGLMNKIPREYFTAMMGRGDTFGDIVKASIAGVVLDLCNHGILVISGKLYDRGLSIAQVLTFLISSPWNSLSLTFILIALIGVKWTLLFTLASMAIAIVSGCIYMALVKNGILPENPNTADIDENFDMKADFKARMKDWKFSWDWVESIIKDGWMDGKMILRWILFGAVVAAAMKAFVPTEIFTEWFGPTIIGLGLTLLVATIVEICSEGSAPIAAEIMSAGQAPGNGFTFLMAGVATDYTEILVVREFSKSWAIALSLPLVTVPQIIVLGLIFNMFG
ncbi:MAG: permease [Alphaproteobacteria bacterium]|nr:permease [Alphaproteobacteria bacterium]